MKVCFTELKARTLFAFVTASAFTACVFFTASSVSAQKLDGLERGRAKDMLSSIKKELKDKYYDSTFRGIDIDARFKTASEKLDSATSLGQAFGIIAQAMVDLNDSHTVFYPPARAAKFEYGWRMKMIGNKAYIIAVKPKSDADKQGLKVGDEVVAVEGFRPNRKEMWKVNYYYNALSPRAGLKLDVRSPGSEEVRELNLASKVTPKKAVLNFEDLVREFELSDGEGVLHRFNKVGNTLIWRMPSFVLAPEEVDSIMRGRVSQSSNLILDLRGNGGGYVVALEALTGYFVDQDTKIADLKGRKEMKPQMAKFKGKDVYRGKLAVLIDSESGSASELFARFIQLQKRGMVLGDQSAGAVMQSRSIPMKLGADSIVPFGISVTNADVIMGDGASLEHVGVTPDTKMLVTGADLAAGRDPVLAAALKLFGSDISPEDAGKLFPYNWDKDN